MVYNDASIFLTLSIIKPDGFIIGTLYELRRVSGCVSVREWMQSQVNEQTNEDLHLDFDNMDFHRTNPATGLPMSGIGVDIGGNSYGYSSKRYDE